MPLSVSKPTFTFFKLQGCSACDQFQRQFFERLVKDPEVLRAVNIDEVMFGRGADGEDYSLRENYPDFADKVTYAPFLWLAQAYDESRGYHLDPATMFDTTLNLRLNGEQFPYRRDTTYEGLKAWLLKGAGVSGAEGGGRGFKKAGGKVKRQ